MFKTMKKVWRYISKYKKTLIITISAMLIVQFLGLLSPLIVKNIMDEYLVAIENTWYEVDSSSENTVEYNNRYFQQEEENDRPISIIINKMNYYFIEDEIEEGGHREIKEVDDGYRLIIKSNDNEIYEYSAIKLNKGEVKIFYQPFIQPLKVLIILLGLRFLLQIIFTYIQRISTAKININITQDARNDAVASLQRMPISYFESEPAGKIANRVIHDVGGMMSLFSTMMNLLLNASLSVIFAYVGMFYLDAKLALLTFIIFPLVYVWLKVFVRSLNTIAEKVNEQNSLITAELNEIINGISILQVFNYQEETEDKFNRLSKSYIEEQLKETKLHLTLGWNMIRLIGSLVTAVIVLYFGGSYLTIAGFTVTAGTIYAYNNYLSRVIEPVGILFREIGNLQHSLVRTERIFKIIDGPQEDDTFEKAEKFKGDIKFEDVTFSYIKGNPVLKNINLDIKAGSMIGLVGHTGSGKSSMMNLLLRFYDIEDYDFGKIYIDGIDITTLPKRTYRQHIGIILQDPVLFSGTILDNIKFGSNISDDEVLNIINSIGGKEMIDKLPNGIYEEITRGGGNLSVGEKQIISFARVIAHDPSILIMDEATANIDTETESIIQKALEKVKKGRTLIIIAHRLSTIKNADKIVVLENGYIVEEGTHQKLLENDSVYANIYRSQIKNNV